MNRDDEDRRSAQRETPGAAAPGGPASSAGAVQEPRPGDRTSRGPRRSGQDTGHRRWEVAALVLTVLAPLVPVGTWNGALFVAGGHVVLGWALSALLAVAAVVIRLVARGLRRGAARRMGGANDGSGARAGVLLSWPMTMVLTLIGTVAVLGAAADTVVNASYVTLAPTTPQGCRVIVRETSFLSAGSGAVYTVPAGTGVGRRISYYGSDDGYCPADGGFYELVWDDDSGALVVLADRNDAVTAHDKGSFTC